MVEVMRDLTHFYYQANDFNGQLSTLGHINHSLFWQNLAPKNEGGGELPKGSLLSAIQKEWGSFESFVSQFNTAAAAVQGKVQRFDTLPMSEEWLTNSRRQHFFQAPDGRGW